jgi:SARP family transcriptional regulator, regulator of embCAB operon
MNTRLVSYRKGKVDLSFPLQGKRVTLGREDDNMIQLPHEKVSKYHAVILSAKEGWAIEDLKSTNGVFVNNKRIERVVLRDGDSVKIGAFEFFFEVNAPSDGQALSHIIDLSTQAHQPTMPGTKPPEQK